MDTSTKELLHYMQTLEGYSKKSALAILKGLTHQGQTAYLHKLRAQHLASRDRLKGVSSSSDAIKATVGVKKVPYSLLLPPSMLDALRSLSERDGSSVSHHIRAAIKSYLSRNK